MISHTLSTPTNAVCLDTMLADVLSKIIRSFSAIFPNTLSSISALLSPIRYKYIMCNYGDIVQSAGQFL